jgi:outer membrane immunogenic protein
MQKFGLLAFAGAMSTVALGAATNAADMPAKAPVYKAPPVVTYDWNGFYLGAYYGAAVRHSDAHTNFFAGSVDNNAGGITAGVTAGYNWQFTPNWLVGIEGDVGYLSSKHSFKDMNDPTTVGVKTKWDGTVRGRFGYVAGPSVVYATGGVAFVGIEDTFGGSLTTGVPPSVQSDTRTGWTAGGGIETKLSRNWSTKSEYLYIDAGDSSFSTRPLGGATVDTVTFHHQIHLLKTGLNYRFGGPLDPIPFMAAPFSSPDRWNGFYVGAFAGGGLSLTHIAAGVSVSPGGETDMNGTGFTGGGQAGYNWIIGGRWLAGVEGDVGYLGINRSYGQWDDVNSSANITNTIIVSQKTDWYATARGRLGVTTGPALFYGTAGAAWVRVRDGIANATLGVSDIESRTASGWVIGGGTEIALDARWSAKLDFLYIDVGHSQRVVPNGAVLTNPGNFADRFEVIRAGLSYKLGG